MFQHPLYSVSPDGALVRKVVFRMDQALKVAQASLIRDMEQIVKETSREVNVNIKSNILIQSAFDANISELNRTHQEFLQDLPKRPSLRPNSKMAEAKMETTDNSLENIIDYSVIQNEPLNLATHSSFLSTNVRERLSNAAIPQITHSNALLNAIVNNFASQFNNETKFPADLIKQTKHSSQTTKPKKRKLSLIIKEDEEMEDSQPRSPDSGVGEEMSFSEGAAQRNNNIVALSLKCHNDECSVFCETKAALNQHMMEEHGMDNFRCLQINCGKSYRTKDGLSHHLRDEHGRLEKYTCPKATCLKTFDKYEFMSRHVQWIHFQGEFKCAHDPQTPCDYVGNTRGQVYAHYKVSHKRFDCEWPGCNSSFKQMNNLKRHERAHTGVKPYYCSWTGCDYKSSFRSTLINHVRMTHFCLPSTIKEQEALGIEDNRDPRMYLGVYKELL